MIVATLDSKTGESASREEVEEEVVEEVEEEEGQALEEGVAEVEEEEEEREGEEGALEWERRRKRCNMRRVVKGGQVSRSPTRQMNSRPFT